MCRVHLVRSIFSKQFVCSYFHFFSVCYFSAHSEAHMYRRALKHERRFFSVLPREAFRLAGVPNCSLNMRVLLLLVEGQ